MTAAPHNADRFPASVRKELELKAGTLCSAPFCRERTTSGGGTGQIVRIGVAAHITAASPGGARFNPSMTPEDRRSSINGIWLCQDHARLIDVDPDRYSASLLHEWKRIAERLPLLSPYGETNDIHDLPRCRRIVNRVDRGATSEAVRSWSFDIGLEKAWGPIINQACGALFLEIIYNIFDHSDGVPAAITLSAWQRVVTLSYPGTRFGLREWDIASHRGGGTEVLGLALSLAPSVTVSHTYRSGVNRWYIAYRQRPGDGCGLNLADHPNDQKLDNIAGCSIVRIYAAGGILSLSDPMRVLQLIRDRGVTQVNVMDISDTHFLANSISAYASELGIELLFLGIPPDST